VAASHDVGATYEVGYVDEQPAVLPGRSAEYRKGPGRGVGDGSDGDQDGSGGGCADPVKPVCSGHVCLPDGHGDAAAKPRMPVATPAGVESVPLIRGDQRGGLDFAATLSPNNGNCQGN